MNNKGITLIALIITIIILIILTGLTIDFAINDKLFNTAESVKNKSEEQMNTQQQMANEVRNLYK